MTQLDRRHWMNWWRLLVPPRVWGVPSVALAIVEERAGDDACAGDDARAGDGEPRHHPRALRLHRLILAGVRGEGVVDAASVPWRGVGEAQLGALARHLGVPAVVVIARPLIATLSRQLEPVLHHHQDLVEQGLLVLRVLKGVAGRGLWTYPDVLGLLPAPSYDGVQRTFDLLIPDDSALVGYVIDDDRQRVHASVIARKHGGHLDQLTTHRAVRDAISEATLARTWQTAYPRVLAAITERLARPSVGVFLERATLQRILTGPSDQLSRELSARRVILDPAPTWLLGLLGGATVAAVAGRGARVLAAMMPASARGRATELVQRANAVIRDSGMHPFALLGFDPIALWARLQGFYRQEA